MSPILSPILKKQLSFLTALVFMGGALQWASSALHAQDSDLNIKLLPSEKQRVPLTRDEAATNFGALLEFFNTVTNHQGHGDIDPALASSVAPSSDNSKAREVLLVMAAQWKQPYRVTATPDSDASTAVVTIEKAPRKAPRPLVLVKEKGTWGVDLIETYARWNNLDASGKAAFEATVGEDSRRVDCQSNLRQVSYAMALYCQDYDEVLPPAKTWSDSIWPYTHDKQILNCPSTNNHGFAYNSKLSTKPLQILTATALTVSLYETTQLKNNAFGQGENTVYRHSGGENVAFVDGHVRWEKAGAPLSFRLKN